jgi:hypothetical protein
VDQEPEGGGGALAPPCEIAATPLTPLTDDRAAENAERRRWLDGSSDFIITAPAGSGPPPAASCLVNQSMAIDRRWSGWMVFVDDNLLV